VSTERQTHTIRLKELVANILMDNIEGLNPFHSCIEASDALASTSTSSGRGVDNSTGLIDCSVLVSPDGELLIIPQQQHSKEGQEKQRDGYSNGTEESDGEGGEEKDKTGEPERREGLKSWCWVQNNQYNELGEEYNSSVFLGNDLRKQGDKKINGFSAKGWSTAAASLALKQSADSMGDLTHFLEELVLNKELCTAQDNQRIDKLRSMIGVEQTELTESKVASYQKYLQEKFSTEYQREKQTTFGRMKLIIQKHDDVVLEVSPDRVGPLNYSEGTIPASLRALENYYSKLAESDSRLWSKLSKRSGALTKLQNATEKTHERVNGRQVALQETMRRIKAMEDYLRECKEEAMNKWDRVHQTEIKITGLLEEKMAKRNRIKEKERIKQMKEEEAQRAKSDDGNSGATSSEIWNLVSAATASMEEGSFEPVVDFSNATSYTSSVHNFSPDTGENEAQNAVKPPEEMEIEMDARYEFEVQYRLPELRVVALAAEEAVEDAANTFLSVLSNLDRTRRSAHLAAETCLVSCSNAQASCLRSVITTERESIKERLKLLDELENIVNEIDVRADLNKYITIDKTKPGGRSPLGEDDDGGVASALDHLRSDLGSERNEKIDNEYSIDDEQTEETDDDSSITPEFIEQTLECFFRNDPLLLSDAPKSGSVAKSQEGFEANVLKLCKIGEGKLPKSTTRRSTICYAMNAKRSTNAQIPSRTQFEGLCRVFVAVLSGCGTKIDGGLSSAILLIGLSEHFYVLEEGGAIACENPPKKMYVKSCLVGHSLWDNEKFWDRALHQTIIEKLNYSGVMSNFERDSDKIVTEENKERSEWTEMNKTKWHDLTEVERYEAACQVNAVVFAQVSAMSDSMFEFCRSLGKTSAFIRRACVKNQLPVSQRTTLLRHLIGDSVAASSEDVKND